MAEENSNIVLEQLRIMRNENRDMRSEVMGAFNDVKYRLASVEEQVAGLRSDFVHYSQRTGPLEQRVERVERRLELRDDA